MTYRHISFQYGIGETVLITPLNVPGEVYAQCNRGFYREYRVRYWYDAKHCDEWLVEKDLAPQ